MNKDNKETKLPDIFKNNPDVLKNSPKRTIKRNSFLKIQDLIPFKNHPFKLYEGQRFEDMVMSVRTMGVQLPIIVRPVAGTGTYEILSGHNRVAAAKEAGLDSVPAIIKKGLSDEEALLIVTETNLMQRSSSDLKPSERATALSAHYTAIKKKSGYRSDLIAEIEELSCDPVGHRMNSRERLSEQYNLGSTSIARYLHINNLIPELKERLDQKKIGMRVAESLSFLKLKEQKIIEELLADGKKITMKQAEILRTQAKESELTKTSIDAILNSGNRKIQVASVNLKSQSLSKYFKPEQSADEIEKTIYAALEMYFSSLETNV